MYASSTSLSCRRADDDDDGGGGDDGNQKRKHAAGQFTNDTGKKQEAHARLRAAPRPTATPARSTHPP
eukprot:250660-Rhodomonas_salina.1